jgi:hypothetical protein
MAHAHLFERDQLPRNGVDRAEELQAIVHGVVVGRFLRVETGFDI